MSYEKSSVTYIVLVVRHIGDQVERAVGLGPSTEIFRGRRAFGRLPAKYQFVGK